MRQAGYPAFLVAIAVLGGCGGGGGGATVDASVNVDAAGIDAPVGSALLAELRVTTGVLAPPFEPTVREYDLDLILAETETSLTATAATPEHATIEIDGVLVPSGTSSAALPFSPGSRDIDIVVAAAGARATYRVHVHRGVDALADLQPSVGALTPAFASATLAYDLELPVDQADIALTPTLLVPERSAVTVAGIDVSSGTMSSSLALSVGSSPVAVVVTPTTRPAATTSIGTVRGSDALSSLEVSSQGVPLTNPLLPSFDPAGGLYAVDVGLWIQQVQLTVRPVLSSATVTIGGAPATTGVPSAPIALALGPTSIPVVVTAPDGTARTYILTITRGAQVLQQAYVKASNTGANDKFGTSVSVWGDTLVVGASTEDSAATGIDGNQADDSATSSGAAYVFVRSGTTWAQQAYLKASNSQSGFFFGEAVSVRGDVLAVGAPANNGGAVYVFRRSGTVWTQQAIVTAPNAGAGDGFGDAVSLWGDTLAVGADGEDSSATGIGGDQNNNNASGAGAVYVFVWSGATWDLQAYLKASNTGSNDRFGTSVSLWVDTLAVGADGEDSAATGIGGNQADNNAMQSGAAYVFTRSGTTWTQQAYIKASNTGTNDAFGVRVAAWGDTVAVGANGESSAATGVNGNQADNSASFSGAAYVFTRAGTTWAQQAYLKASNTRSGKFFGACLSLWGDTLAVASWPENSGATGLDGDPTDQSAPESGAVYVFVRTSGTWAQHRYVKASNTGSGDYFGVSQGVSLWGDTLAVGATAEDSAATGVGGNQADNSASSAGAVYVFR